MEGEKVKILVIEDNPEDIALMQRELSRHHFDIDFAISGEEGLRSLKEKGYDVVVADYAMPEMTGLDVLDRMKKENYDIPLVIMTGSGSERIAVEAMKKGAYDYLVKSFDSGWLEIFPSIIQNSIERYKMIKEKERAEEELRRTLYQLEKAQDQLKELAITDDLTKLYNRRQFFNQLKQEIRRAKRLDDPLSLIILDIDDFKPYNDRYGHLEGDAVLKKLAEVIKDNIRQIDSAYRYGGEEFAVILPVTKIQDGVIVAERIRKAFEEIEFTPKVSEDRVDQVHKAVSIGIAELRPDYELRDLVRHADDAMYEAKRRGKNRVFVNGSQHG
ncbi:MAG TPA: diguanylate cyclase [Syntrophaceae bacterium]|nr:diguanylate cyclase [Syntrophaceae bacterium]